MQKLGKTATVLLALLSVSLNAFATEPVEIKKSEIDGLQIIERVYVLDKTDNPEAEIPRDNFFENDIEYAFFEIRVQDNTKEETKEHTQTVSIYSDTNNTQSVIAKFKPEMEVSTGDGYAGVLTADFATLNVSSAGYGSKSYTITEKRTYPNLMDADTSLVPKSINKDGSTLNLTNITWDTAAMDNVDGQELAVRYTANATYSGTGTKSYSKGYNAAVTYKGTVKKMVDETIMYTVTFKEVAKTEPELAAEETKRNIFTIWWIYPIIAAILGGGGYGAYRLIRKRKKGY